MLAGGEYDRAVTPSDLVRTLPGWTQMSCQGQSPITRAALITWARHGVPESMVQCSDTQCPGSNIMLKTLD